MQDIAREFLGCDRKPLSLQRMSYAHVSQVVYAITVESIVITLPYINRQLGGDVSSFATLQSATAGFSFIGGIAVGSLQDRIGTKKTLLLAHFSTLANAIILSSARSWSTMMLSTMSGLTMHGFQAATQIAVLCSEPEYRSVALGRASMSYGLGWFTGAMVLSHLMEKLDTQRMLLLVVGSEMILISAVALGYPEDGDLAARGVSSELGRSESTLQRYRQILQVPGVMPQLLFKVGICICGGTIFCMVPQFALDPFGFSAVQTSRLMLIVSAAQLLSQGLIVPLAKRPRLWQLQLGALVTLGVPLFALSTLPINGFYFALAVAPISIGWNVLNNIVNTSLSCAVPESLAGAMLGLSLAPMTATFLISPILSATIFKAFGFKYVAGIACASLVGIQALVAGSDQICTQTVREDDEDG